MLEPFITFSTTRFHVSSFYIFSVLSLSFWTMILPLWRINICIHVWACFWYPVIIHTWYAQGQTNVGCAFKTPFTRYNRLSNRLSNCFDNKLVWQPAGQLVWQPVVSCKRGLQLLLLQTVQLTQSTCMKWLMFSRSERISERFLVPRTLRRVVWASRRVDRFASSTFVMDIVALDTR